MEKEKKQTIKEIIEILKEIELFSSNSPLKHLDEKEFKFTSKSLFKYKIDFVKSLYDEIGTKMQSLGESEDSESRLSFSPSKSLKFNMNDNSNDSKDTLNIVFDYLRGLENQFSLLHQSLDLCLEKWKMITNSKNLKFKPLEQTQNESVIVNELIEKLERKNFHNIENFTKCLENLEKDKHSLKCKIELFFDSMSCKNTQYLSEEKSLNDKKKINKSTMTMVKKEEIKEKIVEEKKEEKQVIVEKIYLGLMECSITKSIDKISNTLSDTNSSTCLSVQNVSSFLAIQESYGFALVIDNKEFCSAKPKKSKRKKLI